MVYIKLTKDGQSWYLDVHGRLTSKELAWVFSEAEANDTVDFMRNRGSYRGYHIEVEPCN